jgi:hypothetical protein
MDTALYRSRIKIFSNEEMTQCQTNSLMRSCESVALEPIKLVVLYWNSLETRFESA